MLPTIITAMACPRAPHSVIGANKKMNLAGHTFSSLGLHRWEQKLLINAKV